MSGWTLQTAGYRFKETSKGQTGSRVYQWTPDGTDELPILGAAWSATFPDCVVRERNCGLHGDCPGNDRWVIEYSTEDSTQNKDNEDGSSDFDSLLKSVDMSGEYQNIGKQDNTYWEASGGGMGAKMEQDMFRRIVTTTVRIPKVYTKFSGIIAKTEAVNGKVNKEPFLGLPAHRWLVQGGTSTEFFNSRGQRRWRVEWGFEMRAVDLDGGGIGGWNHVWNEKEGKFLRTIPYVYTEVDIKHWLF